MSSAPAPQDPGQSSLRAEHELLAKRLEVRGSIDLVRKAVLQAFATFVALGLAGGFAWDRWAFKLGWTKKPPLKPPSSGIPLYLFAALAAGVALLAVTLRTLGAARRRMRVEDADFARLSEVRGRLGLDQ